MTFLAAVCTSDGEHIDLHFGRTEAFLIISVDEATREYTELGYRKAPHHERTQGHCSNWFSAVADILKDVEYVWTEQIGPKPHRVLLAQGISALEVPVDIAEAVTALCDYRSRST